MKRIILPLLTYCAVLSGNAIAKTAPSQSGHITHFKPVPWTLTIPEPELILENDTDRNEIVQIVHKSGNFGTFKLDANQELSCNTSFGEDSHQLSSVCILQPGEKLHIELDFMCLKEAQGTYQIALA